MKSISLFIITWFSCLIINAQQTIEADTISCSEKDMVMSFIGHGTLMFEYGDLVIHIDPVKRYADYSKLPKADIILITHHHFDHFDKDVINTLKTDKTKIILTQTCHEKLGAGVVLSNGESKTINEIKIDAVPAYNLEHTRPGGKPFHPKGEGNGYILTFGDTRIYIGGDTENIPEMKEFKNIDIAFLPMNLPYTMSPEMAADAAKMINPKILYPYHFGKTDTDELVELLKDKIDCEVRIRALE